LIIGLGQNQGQVWQPRKPSDQQGGLNQLEKIDLLWFWQLRRIRAHHYHFSGTKRASLARMMFERNAGVAFEDDEFDP
jgi:hypothetical protein